MLLLKVALVEGTLAVVMFASSQALDGTAQRIVLWTAAIAGLVWLYANVLRPVTKVLRRTAAAVEAFEDLPLWEERLVKVERSQANLENGQAAILRELGIEDQVRRMPPDHWA